MGVIHVSS